MGDDDAIRPTGISSDSLSLSLSLSLSISLSLSLSLQHTLSFLQSDALSEETTAGAPSSEIYDEKEREAVSYVIETMMSTHREALQPAPQVCLARLLPTLKQQPPLLIT